MNADKKARWVAALRSGDFPQTKGALSRPGTTTYDRPGFCCLGVLCELAADDGIIRRVSFSPEMNGYVAPRPNSDEEYTETSILPPIVVKWAGLDTSFGLEWDTDDGHGSESLANLNDNGADFDRIADIIEERL